MKEKLEVKFFELRLRSKERIEVIDITEEVEKLVKTSGIRDGICLIFCPHATCFLMLEEAERRLIQDICEKIKEDFLGRKYRHDEIDNNAFSHLASGFYSQARVIPIRAGDLVRGTWQNVLFVELDGPREERRIIVEIIGIR